jgi:hypothetical protein
MGKTVWIVSLVVEVGMETLVDCESVGSTAGERSPPAPGSLVLPGRCSIEEKLESDETMETGGCVEVDHSLRVSVVINSSPLSAHTERLIGEGQNTRHGGGRTEWVESPVSCRPAMSVDCLGDYVVTGAGDGVATWWDFDRYGAGTKYGGELSSTSAG